MMNKQEAIENINGLWSFAFEDGPFEVDLINKRQAIDIISQIDEPQKPKVPQFVADWIEWCKKNKITLLGADTAICNNKNIRTLDASAWAMKNQEIFAKSWFYGYEVEKEKLYTVEIPNPNHEECPILFKKGDGKVHIIFTSVPCWRTVKNAQLTESEIKKDFEWAFRWAKEVEE